MKRLYDNPDALVEVIDESKSREERKGKKDGSTQEMTDSTQESTQETDHSTQETGHSTQENALSNRNRLILLLQENPRLTLAEAAIIIGLTRNGVKKIADKLRAEGVLYRKGSTKAGEWILKDE